MSKSPTHSGQAAVEVAAASGADEARLLEAALRFDAIALGDLYDLYETKIFNYIYHRCGDQVVAEDLTAQVFLKMLESIRSGNGWTSSFSGWLYRIAHNLVIDHYRQRDRRPSINIDDAPPMAAGVEDPVETAEMNMDADRLRAAIRRLTDEQSAVISLRFLEGYSIAEVATMLDRSEGAVKALQYRAVAALRSLLYDEMR